MCVCVCVTFGEESGRLKEGHVVAKNLATLGELFEFLAFNLF